MECFARGIFQSSFLLKPNFVMSTNFDIWGSCGRVKLFVDWICLFISLRCTHSVVVSLARWTLHRCAQGHGTLHPKSGSFNDTLPECYFFAASVHPFDRFSLEQTLKKLQHYKDRRRLRKFYHNFSPVPRLSRSPPRNSLVANRSWFQMSNSRARSFSSWWVTSSKMKVQFQTGFDVLRQMLVLCLVVLPFSGIRVLKRTITLGF
jgi:hypothetical protein